jgi:hypothetical protein
VPDSQYVFLSYRQQWTEACGTLAHLSAWQVTKRGAMYTTVDAEGGKVRSANGSCAKGKFTCLKYSDY